MHTTYDVRIYKTEVWKGKTKTTYYVRWQVANRRWKSPSALAHTRIASERILLQHSVRERHSWSTRGYLCR